MQSVNPSKSFTLGNVCLRDETDVVTIVSDYENLTIDNNTVWGSISRVTNNSGNGGEIVGNLLGYGCRFEIDGSSFNLGTIINPTSLKIFSKSKSTHHAIFARETGALILGAGKKRGLAGNILETWSGIYHWRGIARFRDTTAFLPPPSVEQITATLDSVSYTFRIPNNRFPVYQLNATFAELSNQTFKCKPSDFVFVHLEGVSIASGNFTVNNDSLSFSTPLYPISSNSYQTVSVTVYDNDDASLKTMVPGGVKFLTDAMMYNGSRLVFSTLEYPDEASIFQTDASPKLVVKGPKSLDLGTNPFDIAANGVELVLPGSVPADGAIMKFKDKTDNLVWTRDIFSDLAKSIVGIEGLTTSQLLGLIMEMKKQIEVLSGKQIKIVKDYESALETGDQIVPPGGNMITPPAGTGGGTGGATGPIEITSVSSPAAQSGQLIIDQEFNVQVAFSGTDGASSPGPAISIAHSANVIGDTGTGASWGLPKWDPIAAVYNFPFKAKAEGNAWIAISPYSPTGGSPVMIPFNIVKNA